MSLQTAAIIPGHVTIGELCAALRKIDGIANVGARQMTRPEYQLIEFLCGNRRSAIHVFLASYAADDYADVLTGESTLLTIEARVCLHLSSMSMAARCTADKKFLASLS